jgi:hypothetical protein
MTKVAAGLLFAGAVLFEGTSVAQTPPDASSSVKREGAAAVLVTAPLCVGTSFNATLTDSIDTRRAKTGDVVTATVAKT